MNSKFKLIGVTGGIGAGKSTVLNYIECCYDCHIFITDMIAYDIMRNDGDCLSEIKEVFKGDDIFGFNGVLDSAKIGKIIFRDDGKRKAMNSIVHPRVIQLVLDKCAMFRECGDVPFAVVESALLIECGLAEKCDEVWNVTAPKNVRIKRLKEGRRYSRQKCDDIIKGQLTDDEFMRHATAVVDTGMKYEDTYRQIDALLSQYGFSKKEYGDDTTDNAIDALAGSIRQTVN